MTQSLFGTIFKTIEMNHLGNIKFISTFTIMKNKGKLQKVLFGLLIGGVSLTSCQKEDPNLISSKNNALADAAFNHIGSVMDAEVNYAEQQTSTNKTDDILTGDHDTCATVTWGLSDDQTYVDTVWIDYGTGGCEWQGRTKTGKILITQNGKRSTIGTVTKIEFIDFTIDEYKIEGIKTHERTAYQWSVGNFNGTDHVLVSNAKVTSPDGTEEFSWESDRIHQVGLIDGEWVALIEGTINGVNTQGTAFTITTSSPLKFKLFCPRIVSGVLNLTPAGMDTRSIDYGDGDCDLKATVTIDNVDYQIILW